MSFILLISQMTLSGAHLFLPAPYQTQPTTTNKLFWLYFVFPQELQALYQQVCFPSCHRKCFNQMFSLYYTETIIPASDVGFLVVYHRTIKKCHISWVSIMAEPIADTDF